MRKIIFFALIFGVVIGLFLRDWLREKPAAAKVVTIRNRNLEFQVATKVETVQELLAEQGFVQPTLTFYSSPVQGEEGFPSPRAGEGARRADEGAVQGMMIEIREPVSVNVIDAGHPREIQTLAETVGDLLNMEKIGLAATDQVSPPLDNFLAEGMSVIIDRIVDLAVTEVNGIPFAIKIEHDPEAYYGRETVVSAGEPGQKQQEFLITYKNGVEIKRRLREETILKEPRTEIRQFGTKVEVEALEVGRASWYVYQGCACAAHPSYEFGRYLRVTSLSSGQSLIVKINDRGPDQQVHPDRVIDLDATAFKELAPLAAGTIGVRVELLK